MFQLRLSVQLTEQPGSDKRCEQRVSRQSGLSYPRHKWKLDHIQRHRHASQGRKRKDALAEYHDLLQRLKCRLYLKKNWKEKSSASIGRSIFLNFFLLLLCLYCEGQQTACQENISLAFGEAHISRSISLFPARARTLSSPFSRDLRMPGIRISAFSGSKSQSESLAKLKGTMPKFTRLAACILSMDLANHAFHTQVHGTERSMLPGRALAVALTGNDQVMGALISQGGCPAAELFIQRLKDEF